MLTVARRYADHATADHVIQDILVKLFCRPDDTPITNFSNWLHSVTRFRTVDAIRRDANLHRRDATTLRSAPSDVQEAVEAADTARRLCEALKALPRPQMEPIVLTFLGGRT